MFKLPFVLLSALLLLAAAKKLPECGPDDSCPDGMICAAKPDRKRCVTPMKLGQRCQRDPFWVCEEGLECMDNTCVKIVSKGESCAPDFTKCEYGLKCAVKSEKKKRCIMPMKLGAACRNDPFWACEDGLVCHKGVCQKKVATEGESCVDPTTVCKKGLVCAAKSPAKKRCVRLMKIGKKCKPDPFWACEDGLVCRDNTCIKQGVEGESCVSPFVECARGLICAEKNPSNKRCVQPMRIGGKCREDPFWVCKAGLKCVDGVCTPRSLP